MPDDYAYDPAWDYGYDPSYDAYTPSMAYDAAPAAAYNLGDQGGLNALTYPAATAATTAPTRAGFGDYEDTPVDYSPETLAYFDKLNAYIAGRTPAYGSYSWAMPEQSRSFGGTSRGVAEEGVVDPDRVSTRYTPNSAYTQYLDKPVEQNALYRFNLTDSSGNANNTGDVRVSYNTPIALVDNSTGKLVYSGVGFDAAQKVAEMARQLSQEGGNKAEWSIFTAPPGATDPSEFKQVAQETQNRGLLGVLGTVLPIAATLIPGLGPLGSLSRIASVTAAGGLGAALKGQNPLLGAAIAGGTAGIMGATPVGDVLGKALSAVPGVGTVSQALVKMFPEALTKGIGSVAGEIVVPGVTNAAATSALLSGVGQGGLQALANSVVPSNLADYQKAFNAQANEAQGALPSPDTVAAVDPNEIVAVANRGAVGGGLSAATAAAPAVAELGLDIATNPARYEEAIREAQQEQAAQQTSDEDLNPITVEGNKLSDLGLPGAAAGPLSAFVGPSVTEPSVLDQVAQQQQESEQQASDEDTNPITVEGNKLSDLGLPGAAAGPLSEFVGPSVTEPSVLDQVAQQQESEQQASDEDTNPITVEGNKLSDLGLPGAAAGPLSEFVGPSVTEPSVLDQVAQQQESEQQESEQQASDEDTNPITVEGNTSGGGLAAATAIAPAVAQLGLDIATNPAKYEQEIKDAQEEQAKQDEGSIVVKASTTPATAPVTVPTGIVSTGNTVPTSVNTDEIVVKGAPANKNVVSVPVNGLISTSGNDVPTSVNTDEIVVKGNAKTDPNAAVVLPTNALTGNPIGAEDGKLTLSKIADYLQLAGLGVGLLGNLGGGSGSGSSAKMPFGIGARNPIYSATLPTPGQNGAFAVGGLDQGTGAGGIGGVTPPGGDYTRFGMGSATRAAPSNIPQYGGVNPPGFNTQTWEWLGPQTGVAKDILDQLAVLPSSAAPAQPEKKLAMGGYAVGGPGDGRSDEIPAMLSDGEYVIDAETVALLGNGSNKAGAQQLDKFRANIRKHKGRELARGKFSVKAKRPEAYLSEGRS